jgi:hypothetical protein
MREEAMTRMTMRTRLRLEELNPRETPSALTTGMPEVTTDDAAVVSTQSRAPEASLPIEDVPLHVSLSAVAAVTLCVAWDRRTRQHHLRRPMAVQ